MKTWLILSLLCLTVCAAAAVPVEDTVHDDVINSSVSDVAVESSVDVKAEPSNSEGDVQQVETEEAVKEKTAGESAPAPLPFSRNAQPPTPIVQGAPDSKCPNGWHQYQNNCYLFINLTYSWPNADAMCENLGSSLASAHNLWEYSFLKQLTWKAGFLTAWIGGYRFQGFWKWDDSTPFDYNNWYYQTSSSYDCIFLNSPDSRGWSNERCNLLHPFICSMKPDNCQ